MEKDYMEYNEIAEMLKILAHPVRLCIINGLLGKGTCNVSHMQDCLGIPQSTLSQHLQKLRMAKIIVGKRNGLEINYSICNEEVRELVEFILKNKD
ncbi:ArsR/SmtB family transcription factor [Clostridium estertheticum]|uniref:Winged helix-turn-helix transcriptional regulator n=1 Tax=Clostridium estertheticum TaxID=238834 RepID=A0A7Y3STP6_9CLOT|nr:metalloregulator ArsR/SmtB family transcription factor [Clostridium estertheticum]MBW9170295.1 metalloregulator ArsR/SmtB family transcription factor [Clostridium estertheticum]MBX4263499.1 metalloregulator ArsR/SmtB family transcription factor [Clostridium estertheticum]MBX4270012.1 metalloregulator ArsR/SmtB family transcription factor [Clostridium estertheticum]NNU74733.1 winged helix-turn-helix transcriptional regulator [Clostridium estertheticum]WBL47200.1 metalloregulator ArsR/SmtB fa